MVRHRRHAEKADVNCDVIQAHHAITLEVRFPANNDWSRSAESVRLLANRARYNGGFLPSAVRSDEPTAIWVPAKIHEAVCDMVQAKCAASCDIGRAFSR